MATMTPEKLEQELLELHLLEDGLKCSDWSRIGCENEATHFVICPCGEGRVPMCERCLIKIREKASRRVLGVMRRALWFSRSCGHTATFEACKVNPI